MKIFFKDKIKYYLGILMFGILMGVLAGIVSRLSETDLWAFGAWGTSALGYWMISTSIIVLGSESRKTAVINTIIYIYSMFFVTAIFRVSDAYLISYATKEAPCSLFEYLTQWDSFQLYFDYCLEIETILAVVASPILYFGRMENIVGKIIRLLPLLCLTVEFVFYGIRVITQQNLLFSTILDLVLIVLYILFIKDSFKKKQIR